MKGKAIYLYILALFIGAEVNAQTGGFIYHSHIIDDDAPSTTSDSNGNDDGMVNPGEEIELIVKIQNASSTTTYYDISASISCTSPFITLVDTFKEYGMVAPPGKTKGVPDFDFVVSNDCPDESVDFQIRIYSDTLVWTDSFTIDIIDCVITASQDTFSYTNSFGGYNLPIDYATCNWTAETTSDFINIYGGSGVGAAPLLFTLNSHSNIADRFGEIQVNCNSFTIQQQGCPYSLSKERAFIEQAGGSDTIYLTTASSCNWNLSSIPSWLTVLGASDGSGNSSFIFQASANNSYMGRKAELSLGSDKFIVYQAPLTCIDTSLVPDTFETVLPGPLDDGFGFVQQHDDGGYIIISRSQSFGATDGTFDILLTKLACDGSVLWNETYGTAGEDDGRTVLIEKDGYLLVGGLDGAMAIMKVDFDGEEIWRKTYGNSGDDLALGLSKCPDGNFIVNGYFTGPDLTRDAVILKINPKGDSLWSSTLSDTIDERFFWNTQDDEGNIFLTGTKGQGFSIGLERSIYAKYSPMGENIWTIYGDTGTIYYYHEEFENDIIAVGRLRESTRWKRDLLVTRFDTTGAEVWNKSFDLGGLEVGIGMAALSTEEFVVAGRCSDTIDSLHFAHLFQFDAELGDTIGNLTFAGSGNDVLNKIITTNDGKLFVGGKYGGIGDGGIGDLWYMKIEPELVEPCEPVPSILQEYPATTLVESPHQIIELADGSFFVSGKAELASGELKILLQKFACDGKMLWSKTHGAAGSDQEGYGCIDAGDGVIVTGSASTGSFTDLFLLKVNYNGDTIWAEEYGGIYDDRGIRIGQAQDGNYFAVGHSNPNDSTENRYILKFAPDGSSIFDEAPIAIFNQRFNAIEFDESGAMYLVGRQKSNFSSFESGIICKIFPSGNDDWCEFVTDSIALFDLVLLGDGLIAVGKEGIGSTNPQGVFVVKYTLDGHEVWRKTYNDGGRDSGSSISKLRDDRVVVVGRDNTGSNSFSVAMVIDTNGNLISTRKIDFGGADLFRSAMLSADSSFVAVGEVYGSYLDPGNQGWSFLMKESAEDITCEIPQNPTTNYSTGSNAILAWDASTDPGYEDFTINGGPVSNPIFEVAGIGSSFTVDSGIISAGTQYVWQVRGNCGDNFESAPTDSMFFGDLLREGNFALNLFPNPTKGEFIIQWENPLEEKLEIQVTDLSGKLILSETSKAMNQEQIDLSGQSPGIYFVKVNGRAISIVEKVVLK